MKLNIIKIVNRLNDLLKRRVLVLLLACAMVFNFSSSAYAMKDDITLEEGLSYIATVIQHKLDNYYGTGYDEATIKSLVEAALEGILEKNSDPYTVFMTDEEFLSYMNEKSGTAFGIGVSVTKCDSGLHVEKVYEGSGAEKAGMLADDIIIKANNIDLKDKTLDEATEIIKGEANTTVTITYYRNGSTYISEIERGEIKVKNVEGMVVSDYTEDEKDNDILYMSIENFNENTYDNFIEELEFYEEKYDRKFNKMIIDLRNNPGGFSDEAIKLCDYFLDKDDMIVTFKDKKGNDTKEFSKSSRHIDNVVILTNNSSASASELFSGALKDNHRAIIVGEHTFGKNVAQKIFSYSGIHYKMTVEEYLLPNGESIRETGVLPNIEIKSPKKIVDVKNKFYGGEEHNDILAAKSMLKFLGYNIVDESNKFDTATIEEVKKFQKDNGLGTYGALDYTTQFKLNEVATNKAKDIDNQFDKALEVMHEFGNYARLYELK